MKFSKHSVHPLLHAYNNEKDTKLMTFLPKENFFSVCLAKCLMHYWRGIKIIQAVKMFFTYIKVRVRKRKSIFI